MTAIEWSPEARADIRRLDRMIAQRVFQAVDRLARTGSGDVVRLHDTQGECRLRVGDGRVRFVFEQPNVLRVLRVRHRSEAYR